jgi:hypothetical protein
MLGIRLTSTFVAGLFLTSILSLFIENDFQWASSTNPKQQQLIDELREELENHTIHEPDIIQILKDYQENGFAMVRSAYPAHIAQRLTQEAKTLKTQ